MQFEHDRHQYFFEKYLRNEMGQAERLAFESKLALDSVLKSDLYFYRLHRKEILEQELAEYDEPILPIKKRNISWIYLIVSVVGIVFVADYFITERYNRTLQE